MLKTVIALAITLSALAQEIPYTLVTSTNVVFWTNTNVPPPVGYALYTSTSSTSPGGAVRRVTSSTNEILASVLFAGTSNAVYQVGISALLANGVETQRSTNIWLYWVPPPQVVVSGVVGIGVR